MGEETEGGARTIVVSGQALKLVDSGVGVQFADVITEVRLWNGIVYLSMGATTMDGDNAGICEIVARLRLSLSASQNMHRALGEMISLALKPDEQSTIN